MKKIGLGVGCTLPKKWEPEKWEVVTRLTTGCKLFWLGELDCAEFASAISLWNSSRVKHNFCYSLLSCL